MWLVKFLKELNSMLGFGCILSETNLRKYEDMFNPNLQGVKPSEGISLIREKVSEVEDYFDTVVKEKVQERIDTYGIGAIDDTMGMWKDDGFVELDYNLKTNSRPREYVYVRYTYDYQLGKLKCLLNMNIAAYGRTTIGVILSDLGIDRELYEEMVEIDPLRGMAYSVYNNVCTLYATKEFLKGFDSYFP